MVNVKQEKVLKGPVASSNIRIGRFPLLDYHTKILP